MKKLSYLIIAILFISCGGGGGDSSAPPPSDPPPVYMKTFGKAVTYDTNYFHLSKTSIGDMNGDGLNDVVTISNAFMTESHILIYYQNTEGMLEAPFIIDLRGADILGFEIGDVNNDGRTDLVVTGFGYLMIVYYQTDAGALSSGDVYRTSHSYGNVVVIADVNSDGLNDILIKDVSIDIFYQNSDGSFSQYNCWPPTSTFTRSAMNVADMDNDNDNDIVVQTNETLISRMMVIKQDSSVPGFLCDDPEYYEVETGFDTYAMALGDVNDDSRNDLVILDQDTGTYLRIFLQNDQGTLDPQVTLFLRTGSYNVEIADVNMDGLNDIVFEVSHVTAAPLGGDLNVVYQEADNTFREDFTPYPYPTQSGGGSGYDEALSVGDVTGDGLPDAVVAWQDEGLYVLPNITGTE